MTEPKVSIIIPCYNAADTIGLCLESCKAQTHENLEIVLVDNNCDDDTVALANETMSDWSREFAVLTCGHQGVTHARNLGFKAASGDYIQWLDADDGLAREKIARQVAFLESNADVDVAYGDWRWNIGVDEHDPDKAVAGLRRGFPAIAYGPRNWQVNPEFAGVAFNDYQLEQWDDYLLRLLEDKWIPSNAYLLRWNLAESLQKQDAWNPQTTIGTDREYFTLAALSGSRFAYVHDAVAEYNTWSDSQMTSAVTTEKRVASLQRLFERFRTVADDAPRHSLTDAHRELLAQDRELWTLPRGRVALGVIEDGGWMVEFNLTGKREPVDEFEAAIIKVLHTLSLTLCLEDHAKVVANMVSEAWERHSDLMQALQRLCRIDVLRRVSSSDSSAG